MFYNKKLKSQKNLIGEGGDIIYIEHKEKVLLKNNNMFYNQNR